MPRLDAQNLAIAVVILTFSGVAWVCGTASQSHSKSVLTDATNLVKQGSEEVAEPVVVESQEFSSVAEVASEDDVTSVAVRSLGKTSRKPLPVKTGTIRGRILFDGTPPEHDQYFEGLPPVDPAVCGQIEHFNESLLVNPLNNGIKNVFVFLIRRPKGQPETPVSGDAVRMTFRGCRLEPRCVVVRAGQKFGFQSDHPVPHNPDLKPMMNRVYSIPPVPTGEVWDFEFKHPEALPFPLTCAIHPWMRGWILVSDHSFATVTDTNGEFVIPNVSYGKHKFRIYHELAGQLERGLEVIVDSENVDLSERSFDASEFGY